MEDPRTPGELTEVRVVAEVVLAEQQEMETHPMLHQTVAMERQRLLIKVLMALQVYQAEAVAAVAALVVQRLVEQEARDSRQLLQVRPGQLMQQVAHLEVLEMV